MAIKMNGAYIEMYEADFDNGEGNLVQEYELGGYSARCKNAQEVIDVIRKQSSGVWSKDIEDYYFINGRLETDRLTTEEGWTPTKEQENLWRKGKLMLYDTRLVVDLLVVPDDQGHEMTDEEADEYGFNIY